MITLRSYQHRAVETVLRRFDEGRRGVVLVLPTGGGKTATASELVRREIAAGGRVLWLAPARELVGQAVAALDRVGIDVGIIMASSDAPARPGAPVQVASIQTALSRGIDFEPTLIVFDEAHLAAAEQWSTLLTRWPNARRLGLTATPARQDGIGLGGLFDVIVVGATIRQLTDAGHLVPLDIIAPSRPLRPGQIAQCPVKAWRAQAGGKQAVLFAPSVDAAVEFAMAFRAAGVTSDVIHGQLPTGDRERVLTAYESGQTHVICNVNVLTTGWDHPPTAVAILARRCGSVGLYIQMAGRILRPAPGKSRALLLDLTGTCRIDGIGRPDADRVYSLDGQGIRSGEAAPPGSFCAVCGAILDGPTCVECGYERPAQEPPKVVNAPVKLLAADFCAGDSPAVQVQRLEKWIREGMAKKHKPQAALFKFKAVYRRYPYPHEIAQVKAAIARSP